jgi:hypothetical protein
MGVTADQLYQSINNVDLPNNNGNNNNSGVRQRAANVMKSYSSLLLALLVLLLCTIATVVLHHSYYSANSNDYSSSSSSSSTVNKKRADISSFQQLIPPGVNLASWYSLEDWFFVGNNGAIEVATPDDDTAANCLPPLHVDGSTGPRWNSETDLLAGLAYHYSQSNKSSSSSSSSSTSSSTKPHTSSSTATTVEADAKDDNDNEEQEGGGGLELGPWGKAIRTIHAFRSSYYDIDTELHTMSELGIKYVRIPVSWCWTDYDPSILFTMLPPSDETTTSSDKTTTSSSSSSTSNNYSYMTDLEIKQKFTCQDPYYPTVYWPAISRIHFQRVLRSCATYNIGVTIDLHTYPGGTSIGTFSGVWPKYSKFWTQGDEPFTATLISSNTSSSTTSDDNNNNNNGGGGGGSRDIGRTLLYNFIRWMESLEVSDPVAFKG